jgi:hypothetical protein
MIKASDEELDKSIESCEQWEWFGGGLVFVGVIATVVIAIIHPRYDSFLEQWGSAIADSLVAVGVAIEIKFGQMAGLRQNELRRRSDEKVAEASERAARAELESDRLKVIFAGRRLLPEQNSIISAVIRDKAASLDVLIEFHSGDPEAFTYGIDIVDVFIDAGVEKIRFCGNAYISGMVFGLWLSASDKGNATSIVNVFTEAGVPINIGEKDLSTHLASNEVAPNLYIFVAPKVPAAIPDISTTKAREASI